MKKILLAAAACSLLALGLTGCPQVDTSSSTGNNGAAGESK
jgi:outer membrane lipoprotein SlyB